MRQLRHTLGVGSDLATPYSPRVFAPGACRSTLFSRFGPRRQGSSSSPCKRPADLGLIFGGSPNRAPDGLALSPIGAIDMVAIASLDLDSLADGRLDLARMDDSSMVMSEMAVGYGEAVAAALSALEGALG